MLNVTPLSLEQAIQMTSELKDARQTSFQSLDVYAGAHDIHGDVAVCTTITEDCYFVSFRK